MHSVTEIFTFRHIVNGLMNKKVFLKIVSKKCLTLLNITRFERKSGSLHASFQMGNIGMAALCCEDILLYGGIGAGPKLILSWENNICGNIDNIFLGIILGSYRLNTNESSSLTRTLCRLLNQLQSALATLKSIFLKLCLKFLSAVPTKIWGQSWKGVLEQLDSVTSEGFLSKLQKTSLRRLWKATWNGVLLTLKNWEKNILLSCIWYFKLT